MGVPTTLTPAAAQALEWAEQAATDFAVAEEYRRTAAVEAITAGAPVSVVAQRINVTRPTLYRWREEIEAAKAAEPPITADDVL